jgi:hypothetical protein
MAIVKQKQQELHETAKIAEQAKTMKKQLGKLEDIIDELQGKNKELNEQLNRRMVERAESYKQQVVEYLQKPKAYDVEMGKEVKATERTDLNSQYRRLGEELNREQMTEVHEDRNDTRKSHNDKSFQDYRRENTFASEYGKNLAVNHSIALPERPNLLQAHNSE